MPRTTLLGRYKTLSVTQGLTPVGDLERQAGLTIPLHVKSVWAMLLEREQRTGWTIPVRAWAHLLDVSAIRFSGRHPLTPLLMSATTSQFTSGATLEL